MRSSISRVLSAAALAALLVGMMVWGGEALRAQVRVKVVGGQGAGPGGKKDEKDKNEDRISEDDNPPFSFPYERDAKNQLKAAREYLDFKEVPWSIVCPLLQNILESKSDSFFNVTYTAGGVKQTNRISVKLEANRIIAAFKPEGLQFYQQLYGQTASALLDEAIKANYDVPMLTDLSRKFFHTRAGAEATVLLGSLHLERGNYLEAADAFERLLGRPNAEEFLTPRTLFKACLALHRSGDPRHAALYKTTLESLRKATARDGLTIGARTYPFDKLRLEVERPLDLIRAIATVGEWAMRDGNPSRTGTVEGGPPFLAPIFRVSMFSSKKEEQDAVVWIKGELEKEFERGKTAPGQAKSAFPLPAFFPITTSDLVVFRGYDGVYGVAARDHVHHGRIIRAGEVQWLSKTAAGAHQLMKNDDAEYATVKQTVSGWWALYSQTKATSILYENPLLGSLAHDGQDVYFVDDIAIPPPPVASDPNFGVMPQSPQVLHHGPIGAAVRAGRLTAVDIRSGMVKWDLGRVEQHEPVPGLPPPPPLPGVLNEDEADKTTDAFHLCLDAVFLGPPLPMNGKLYLLIEQSGVIRLLCLDPKMLLRVPGRPNKVPTLVWSQKLGRPNTSLPQDSIRRYQGATPAAAEGIIVCPTNSGAVVAVDAMSHSLLWAHGYHNVEQNARPQPYRINPNTGMPMMNQQLPTDRWRAGGPIIANGRVVLTAHDSDKLECLDLRSGKLLWSVKRGANDLYVGGVINDRVIVVSRNQVRGYFLSGEDPERVSPKVAFDPVTIAMPTGHGIGGKGVYYIPVREETAGNGSTPCAEIWAINVETGQIVSKTGARKRTDNGELAKYGLGNLVFQDGQVFAQSAWEVACFPQLEVKKAEMDRLLAANPKDPIGLLNRGELLLDDGKLKPAIADFLEAEKNNLPEDRRGQLREKKYVAFTELLRTDFSAGEQYLDEYKRLCELDAAPGESPDERVQRQDEMSRRLRFREFLLAKGRESQGRLGEAFDHYIALARMDEAKTLLEMPDEPNVRMRPDVYVRGRIEAMLRRATDPAARKSLVDRVRVEWNGVKAGNDLKQLRDFVAVFGPFFEDGAEAQLLLAAKLIETNNDADAREAQTYLAQLRATCDTPSVRARATETLARFMVANHMMEDAVGLYLQLGRDYPDVVIRDGKTGAAFVTGLLTDKRLLPYLEPSRYPMPARVKAVQQASQAGIFNARFEVEPKGDLFPTYRRYRFMIDQTAAGNGSWSLQAIDRGTGLTKCAIGGLAPPQAYNLSGLNFSNYFQANGQLLLVQLGTMVYCLDLAEKKERWQRNLMGDSATGQLNQAMQNPDADGDVVVKFEDGYIITLGKAAVLQPGYAALLTRDGLEVVEPLTRRQLWNRKGIQPCTQLYGDANYLVLVELDPNTFRTKKPVGTKVLRAVDGMPVEGSPDLGPVLQAAKSYQIMGGTALLLEGGDDKPRVLRLLDLVTGKDVWRKQYDSAAVPIKTLGQEWCGCINPTGEAEVIDTRTGRVTAKLQIDAKNLEADLKPCGTAQLFHDADRFYLVLDRAGGSTNGSNRQPIYNNSIRTQPINGPMYAFERTTGKRIWFQGRDEGLLENQMLILEQFGDLPVIMVAGPMTRQGRLSYPVVVIEKDRGKLLLTREIQYNGNFFHNLVVDMRNGTVNLNRFDIRIEVTPEEKPE